MNNGSFESGGGEEELYDACFHQAGKKRRLTNEFKTKQLEKDYNALKTCFDKLKTDHDPLLHQNDKLKQQVKSLKEKLMGVEEKEKSGGDSEVVVVAMNNCKQEDVSSAKSDLFDSDSPPHHTADSSTKSL
ncbi:homeobox-leucine zipper protein HAT5-like isoform X1 [Senna tora]|uniref:Homeobox-leucine zipper protein n=1 Tax=Senna tora TaxID=362788 RepID=A0A834WH60_9FABA|nr:homeobox-leucine zipper protein HAT5-like isoform X1 [Senna tora]